VIWYHYNGTAADMERSITPIFRFHLRFSLLCGLLRITCSMD